MAARTGVVTRTTRMAVHATARRRRRAFIVYLCWEQSRLQGNQVTLERLTDNEAVVSMDSIFLRLYTQTSHMRELIQQPDYVRIFETIWEDRAHAAGWEIRFAYNGPRCTMRFTRAEGPTPGVL